jgi:hypothetical protein
MSRLTDNFDWLALVLNLGVSIDQIVTRFPQFETWEEDRIDINAEGMKPPTVEETNKWLDGLRHDWTANGSTQIGSLSCRKCGSWTMTNRPIFGCDGHRNH